MIEVELKKRALVFVCRPGVTSRPLSVAELSFMVSGKAVGRSQKAGIQVYIGESDI
jgi:hypothetical protein